MLSAVIPSMHSYPAALLAERQVHQRHVHPGPLVLGATPLKYRRPRQISLLSPAYLLSVERWPFHEGPPDHYDRLSSLLDSSVSQSGRLMPLHSEQTVSNRPEPTIARLRYSLGGDRPSQTTRHRGSPHRMTVLG